MDQFLLGMTSTRWTQTQQSWPLGLAMTEVGGYVLSVLECLDLHGPTPSQVRPSHASARNTHNSVNSRQTSRSRRSSLRHQEKSGHGEKWIMMWQSMRYWDESVPQGFQFSLKFPSQWNRNLASSFCWRLPKLQAAWKPRLWWELRKVTYFGTQTITHFRSDLREVFCTLIDVTVELILQIQFYIKNMYQNVISHSWFFLIVVYLSCTFERIDWCWLSGLWGWVEPFEYCRIVGRADLFWSFESKVHGQSIQSYKGFTALGRTGMMVVFW